MIGLNYMGYLLVHLFANRCFEQSCYLECDQSRRATLCIMYWSGLFMAYAHHAHDDTRISRHAGITPCSNTMVLFVVCYLACRPGSH